MQDVVGPYRIVRALGRGGMGQVLQAVGADGREVAIKTVSVSNPGLREGIRREIHALAGLRHPGIVRIVDHGLDDAGVPWYAMELIPGQTLRRFLDRGGAEAARETVPLTAEESGLEATERLPPPVSRRGRAPAPAAPEAPLLPDLLPGLAIVRRMCGALAFLHGEGLVHRDLKPDNVVIRPDGTPVLVDFGLAVAASAREALSSADGPAGTASYVAPEQAAGALVDARADLYALGCILFEVVTGRVPFAGSDLTDLLWQHRHAAVPRLRMIRPDAPEGVDALVGRLLAKDPADRIGYAEDVEAALGGLGVPPPPPGPRPRPYLYRPSLVGRDAPVAALASAVDGLLQEGSGGTLLLSGETGAGKTRLLIEAAAMAHARGLTVLRGDATGAPFSALAGPLEQAMEAAPDDAEPRDEAMAAALAPYLPGRTGVPGAPELPPKDARLRLFAAVASVLAGAARARPVLLLLDGLDRADELTLAWLAHEVRGGPRPRLLVVGALRPEHAPPELLRTAESAGVRLIRLEALDAPAVEGLVASMLSCREVPQGLARLLAERSAGNPYFVAEYLRLAVAQGLLTREAGTWTLAPSASARRTLRAYEALPVPGTLMELARERVRSLSSAAAETLGMAAVLGPAASPAMLEELASGRDRVEAATHELLARDIAVMTPGGAVSPALAAVGDVARDLLPDEVRRRVHRAAAEALAGARDPGDLARAGAHWEGAGDLDRARRLYRDGAAGEMARVGFAEAADLLQRFLRLSTGVTAEDVDAGVELGRALRHCGRVAEAEAPLLAARRGARQLGDVPRESDVLRGLAHVRRQRGDPDQALALSTEALALARAAHAPREEASALTTLGAVLSDLGRAPEARRAMEDALSLSRRADDARGISNALGTLGAIAFEEGRLAEADSHFAEAHAVSTAHGNDWGRMHALANLAAMAATLGEDARARALSEEGLGVARAIGDLGIEATLLVNLAVMDQRCGALEESTARRRRALALYREIGELRMAAVTLSGLGELASMAGDVGGALAMAEEALVMHRAGANPRGEGMTLRLIAALHLVQGRPDAARIAAEAALARAVQIGDPRHEAMSLDSLAAATSDDREAGRTLDRAMELLDGTGDEHALLGILIDRAERYRLEGDLDRAAALLDRLAPYEARPKERVFALHVTCERGILAARRGEDPRPYLARAEEEAAAMGIRSVVLPGGRLAALREAASQAPTSSRAATGDPTSA